MVCLLLHIPEVNALNVTSGVMIQSVRHEELLDSSTLTVSEFFDVEQSSIRLLGDITQDVVNYPGLASNQFVYQVNDPLFLLPDRSTQASDFSYDANNLTGTASGAIGLSGVMRFSLPFEGEYFVLGDWTIEYDESRKAQGGSGWAMRNWYQNLIAVVFDIADEMVFENADSFYLSGSMGWSPEFTEGFSGVVPESETYRVVADMTLCAQDDEALVANPVRQIPCVFPNILINGQRGEVTVTSAADAVLTVDLGLATQQHYPTADYFAAFIYQNTIYWLNNNFEWTTDASAAYQGALIDVRSFRIPAPDIDFAPGDSIPFYFGVDANQNGVFDEPSRYVLTTLKVK